MLKRTLNIALLVFSISSIWTHEIRGAEDYLRVHLFSSGSLNFNVAAQGASAYEQSFHQYTHNHLTLYWPFSFLGMGAFYSKNWLSRQKDDAWGARLSLDLPGIYFAANYGKLSSTYSNFSIDSRSGTLLTLETGFTLHLNSYFYFSGSICYLSKTYKKENGNDMIVSIYRDVAFPFLGLGIKYPPSKD